MGKPSAPSPPQPPDPYKVAGAQGAADVRTAIAQAYLSNINQSNPFGSVEYNVTGYKDMVLPGGKGDKNKRVQIPLFESIQRLTPDQQKLLNLQELTGHQLGATALSQSKRLDALLGSPLRGNDIGYNRPGEIPNAPNLQGLNPNWMPELVKRLPNANFQLEVGDDDFEQSRRRVEEALFSRLEPRISQDREALYSRLANQGITQGSEAYNNALTQFQQGVNDARMQAILAGGQEQSRLFGMDVTQGQFYNQALGQDVGWEAQRAAFENQTAQQQMQNRLAFRDYDNNIAQQNWQLDLNQVQAQDSLRKSALQELIALRNQPIAETTALMGGGAPTIPQFQPWNAPTLARTPVAESVYNSAALANQQYGYQMQANNAQMGGMYGLGGTLLSGLFGKSDRKLKQDITEVGQLYNGLKVYAYRFKTPNSGKFEIGLMADEVEQVHPEAVATFGEHKYVRYDLAVQPVEQGEAA